MKALLRTAGIGEEPVPKPHPEFNVSKTSPVNEFWDYGGEEMSMTEPLQRSHIMLPVMLDALTSEELLRSLESHAPDANACFLLPLFRNEQCLPSSYNHGL